MKCKECSCCHRTVMRRWTRTGIEEKEIYECWGVKEPFEIDNINHECYEYPEKRNTIGLKPCPFCGNFPKIHRSNFSERYRVRCENGCGAETAPFSTKEMAIKAWNRRIQ